MHLVVLPQLLLTYSPYSVEPANKARDLRERSPML